MLREDTLRHAVPVDGVMSFARLEFEVAVIRELARIGATKAESEAYLEGLRYALRGYTIV